MAQTGIAAICTKQIGSTHHRLSGTGKADLWLSPNVAMAEKLQGGRMPSFHGAASHAKTGFAGSDPAQTPVSLYKQGGHRYENLLNRKFVQNQLNCRWVTDITYIITPQRTYYLCAIMDLCGRYIIAYRIGTEMTASLVSDTVSAAFACEKGKVASGLALHSDQGCQYTSQEYFALTQEYHFAASISRRGCPYDNAIMENFFGTFKTECLYRCKPTTGEQVQQLVDEYIQFYNYERIDMKNGLTPFEIRSKAA